MRWRVPGYNPSYYSEAGAFFVPPDKLRIIDRSVVGKVVADHLDDLLD